MPPGFWDDDEVGQKDVIFLVADTNMQHVIKGVLSRPESLAIRQLACEIYVHPGEGPRLPVAES